MGLRRNGTKGFIRLATIVAISAMLAAMLAVPASGTPGLIEISHLGPDTVVTEGGANDFYVMRLKSRPVSDVVITIDPRGDVVVSPTSLVFTPDNFNSYQGVLVSAMNDLHTEVTETVMLRHTAASADGHFRGAEPFSPSDGLPVVILDNDRHPQILLPSGDVCLTASGVRFAGIGGRLQILAIIVDGIPEVLATVGMDEMWSTTATLDDGDHTAVAKDADGRVSDPVEFSVDTVAPSKPVITSPAPGETVGATVPVEGTADPGAEIALADGTGAPLGSTTTAGDGTWSIEVTYAASGPQTLIASTADCGVTVTSDPVEFTVDAAPPAITIRSSGGLQVAPGAPLRIEGAATDGAGVRTVSVVVVNGATGAETMADVSCGCPASAVNWTAESQSLPGRYELVVTAVDVFGNAATETISLVKV